MEREKILEIMKNAYPDHMSWHHADSILTAMQEAGVFSSSTEVLYILTEDSNGNMRSSCTPFGVAVKTEAEAKEFEEKGDVGYFRSYSKVILYKTWQEGVQAYKDSWGVKK